MVLKKVCIAMVILLMSVALLWAGGQKEGEAEQEAPQEEQVEETTQEKEEIVIGISKFVQHPALDGVEQGIQDELAELGWDNITYDLQNANADANTAAQIATKFKSENVDLAVGIATPTAQALVKAIDTIPVVFSAVTDPVSAGLVESLDKGGDNVTGYSDMTPVEEQITLLTEIVEIEKLGHVYASGETNAVVLANLTKKVCDKKGIEFIESTVSNSSEVKQAAQSIANRVDGYYVSTDNTVVSALSSLCEVALDNGKPVMSADPSSAKEYDVLAALGFDYYKHGRATGRLIDRILKGEDPENIPTQFMSDPSDVDQLLINLDVAEQLGIEIPREIMDRANMVIENGEMTEK
jgi:putative ABC transport system substrate-binding protein